MVSLPSFFLLQMLDLSLTVYICYIYCQESLKYRLLGSDGDIGSWGHEYVRLAFRYWEMILLKIVMDWCGVAKYFIRNLLIGV